MPSKYTAAHSDEVAEVDALDEKLEFTHELQQGNLTNEYKQRFLKYVKMKRSSDACGFTVRLKSVNHPEVFYCSLGEELSDGRFIGYGDDGEHPCCPKYMGGWVVFGLDNLFGYTFENYCADPENQSDDTFCHCGEEPELTSSNKCDEEEYEESDISHVEDPYPDTDSNDENSDDDSDSLNSD